MKDNMLDEFINPLKHAFRTRKGFSVLGKEFKDLNLFGKTIHLDNEIPGIILDVFDNLGFITKDKRKPQIVNKKRTDYGWHLVINLPPGISFSKVKRQQDAFSDAVKGFVVMSWNGALQMDVQTSILPTQVKYNFDPGPYYENMGMPVCVGISQKGVEVFDLASSPHMLIAGIPGFGKSNFLHVLVHSLLGSARIIIIDLKRLEFSYLKDHVMLAKTEKDAILLLKALNAEHDRRVEILEDAGVVKVQDYKGDDMPYMVVVIDEVAELRDEYTHDLINRLLRLSRATGISIVSATQRPSVKVIDGDSRAQYAARLCYLVADETNSRMVLGEECSQAAYLPATHKGRAIFKFGHELKEVQTMFLPLKQAKKLIADKEKRGWNIDFEKSMLPK